MSNAGLTNKMLDAADAGFGFYATLFDTMQDRIDELREAAPKRLLHALITRQLNLSMATR